MPRKTKKSSQKIKAQPGAEKKNKEREEEKENQCTNLEPLELKTVKDPGNLSNEEKKPQHKLFSRSENMKPLGFWRKKLQDLEENETKNKMCRLYEFSGTDESESSYRIKKKPKCKTRLQKKRQTAGTKFIKPVEKTNKIKPELKSKQVQRKTVAREKVRLGQTGKQGSEKSKKLIFSTGTKPLGITSTPAVKKDNLVEECNFLFLSPIIKEEIENDNSDSESLLFKEKVVHDGSVSEHFASETPKLKPKLKRISCRRVLRSGKVIG